MRFSKNPSAPVFNFSEVCLQTCCILHLGINMKVSKQNRSRYLNLSTYSHSLCLCRKAFSKNREFCASYIQHGKTRYFVVTIHFRALLCRIVGVNICMSCLSPCLYIRITLNPLSPSISVQDTLWRFVKKFLNLRKILKAQVYIHWVDVVCCLRTFVLEKLMRLLSFPMNLFVSTLCSIHPLIRSI